MGPPCTFGRTGREAGEVSGDPTRLCHFRRGRRDRPHEYRKAPMMHSPKPNALLLAVVASALLMLAPAAHGASYLLRPDRVWTADDAQAHAGWAVLVEDNHISAVGPAGSI